MHSKEGFPNYWRKSDTENEQKMVSLFKNSSFLFDLDFRLHLNVNRKQLDHVLETTLTKALLDLGRCHFGKG